MRNCQNWFNPDVVLFFARLSVLKGQDYFPIAKLCCKCTSRHSNLVLITPDNLVHNLYMKRRVMGVAVWNGCIIRNKIDYRLCGQLDELGLRLCP